MQTLNLHLQQLPNDLLVVLLVTTTISAPAGAEQFHLPASMQLERWSSTSLEMLGIKTRVFNRVALLLNTTLQHSHFLSISTMTLVLDLCIGVANMLFFCRRAIHVYVSGTGAIGCRFKERGCGGTICVAWCLGMSWARMVLQSLLHRHGRIEFLLSFVMKCHQHL